MARIELRGLTKQFGESRVVDEIDLMIDDGEFVVLLGPSGCGKTTTLRMIAGLEPISSGELVFDDKIMNDEPAERRGVGMVFQNYALYPHMTVAANLSFGLASRRGRSSRRVARQKERARVQEIARLLEIEHVLDRRPKELSGGQRQRVALGRALARDPDVFLLDEPLSNLDASLRDKMRMELARLHAELPITTLYVTHDQGEALTLADQLVVMNGGKIAQAGSPREIYARPADSFVAAFLGSPGMNLWPLGAGDNATHQEGLRLPDKIASLSARAGRLGATVGIRPEHLHIAGTRSDLVAHLTCRVQVVENLGSHLLLHGAMIDQARADVVAKLEPQFDVGRGDTISFGARAEHVHVFDAESGARIDDAVHRGGTPLHSHYRRQREAVIG